MRLQKRNCVTLEYLPYEGLETDLDENGLHTGVFRPEYGMPVKYVGNISAPSGSAIQAFDGLEVRYSHVLILDNVKADIREEGKVRYRNRLYTVTAVRPSLNVMLVALLADTVNNGDQYIDEPEEEPEEPVTGET